MDILFLTTAMLLIVAAPFKPHNIITGSPSIPTFSPKTTGIITGELPHYSMQHGGDGDFVGDFISQPTSTTDVHQDLQPTLEDHIVPRAAVRQPSLMEEPPGLYIYSD